MTALSKTLAGAIQAAGGKTPSDLIKQRARLLAAAAVKTYNPAEGVKLETHVASQLRQLARVVPAVNDPFSPNEHIRRDLANLTTKEAGLRNELGREPTDEELAQVTGLPMKRVLKLQQMQGVRAGPGFGEDDDDEQDDTIAESHTPYDDWMDAVYHDIGEQDKKIMQYRTGYRGAPRMSNLDIARRLGVSPALVSQRAARIQEKLDEFHRG